MKLNSTDTENTGKHIPKGSIESGMNIDINQVLVMTVVIMTKSQSQIVGIVVNTEIRVKNNNQQRVISSGGNRSVISGNIFCLLQFTDWFLFLTPGGVVI